MKTLTCGDILPGCTTTITGETEEEVLQQAGRHAVEIHGLEVTPELVETVRAQIHDSAMAEAPVTR
jgi:predicted small metal-binding protein